MPMMATMANATRAMVIPNSPWRTRDFKISGFFMTLQFSFIATATPPICAGREVLGPK